MGEHAIQRQDSQTAALRRLQRRPEDDEAEGPNTMILRLQSSAGNAAVTEAMAGPAVQRHTPGGGDGAQADGADNAPNPILAALWRAQVVDQIHKAANAMVDTPPDYKGAWDATKTALDTTNTALQAVPKTDPRVVNGIYLQDDLVLSLTILAPRANVPISTSDDSIAAKLGGMEYDAQVVGESLGGEPAPRQHIDPNLDKKE